MKPTSFRGRPLVQLMVLVFLLASILFPVGEISAALVAISGLYNTGVDDVGGILADGQPEQHYQMTGADTGAFIIGSASKPYPWYTPQGQYTWIGPENGGSDAPAGNYIYTLTFDLAGLDPLTAAISGSWASDNASSIYLNDFYTGIFRPERDPLSFSSLLSFEILSGFVEGENTLQFYVSNPASPDLNPSGLLVANLTGTASEVPIPGTVWLLGSALVVLAGIRGRLSG